MRACFLLFSSMAIACGAPAGEIQDGTRIASQRPPNACGEPGASVEDDEPVRAAYERGRAAYDEGRYDVTVRSFLEVYKHARSRHVRMAVMNGLARAYERAGMSAQVVQYLDLWLWCASPDDPMYAEVQRRVTQHRVYLSRPTTPSAQSAPGSGGPEPSARAETVAPRSLAVPLSLRGICLPW